MKLFYTGAMVLLLTACASVPTDNLKQRASFDFSCPQEKLNLLKIDKLTRGVEGCGKKAVYVASCVGFNCTWILNTNKSELK